MLNIERVEGIMQELKEKKSVQVADLARKYYISESIVRRYLNDLEKEGLVHRTYGGAILLENSNQASGFQIRQKELV